MEEPKFFGLKLFVFGGWAILGWPPQDRYWSAACHTGRDEFIGMWNPYRLLRIGWGHCYNIRRAVVKAMVVVQ
jgi:hypothetical protein